jgi:hypothetical protein
MSPQCWRKLLSAHKGTIPPNAGKGRVKGVPNKTTTDVRAAIALFAEANVEKLQAWLDAIGKRDPSRAADLYVRVLEYHIPKLARIESRLDGDLSFSARLVIKAPPHA